MTDSIFDTIDKIRTEVSCCCSHHRYTEITNLCNQLEKIMNENVVEINNEERYKNFIKKLLDPEMFGHAVTAEVRDEARYMLGMKRVETVNAK